MQSTSFLPKTELRDHGVMQQGDTPHMFSLISNVHMLQN